MKKIITVGVFFTLFACVHLFGQNLVATCSSLEVTGLGSTAGIYVEGFATKQTNQFCLKVLLFGSSSQRQYMLSKFDGSNYVTVSGWQLSSLFTNLSKGTYKVTIRTPTVLIQSGCSDGTSLMNSVGQIVGKIGTWVNTVTASAVVGAPAQSDNQWTFLNGNGNQILNTMFDPTELIKINATTCSNFDRYGVAIQEFYPGGAAGRWRSKSNNGLINNAINPLGIEDLRTLWDPNYYTSARDPNWQFTPGNTYRVQVTLSNSTCSSWIDNLQTFYVCPSTTSGCRVGNEQTNIDPTISPNPVSQTFKIDGIVFNSILNANEELTIHDLTGRLVKKFKTMQNDAFDVSDLNTGVYLVSMFRDNHRLFTKKLMINR